MYCRKSCGTVRARDRKTAMSTNGVDTHFSLIANIRLLGKEKEYILERRDREGMGR